jgi:hypothetical protein
MEETVIETSEPIETNESVENSNEQLKSEND